MTSVNRSMDMPPEVQASRDAMAGDVAGTWTDNDIPEHPLNAARGILIGLALSTLIWAAILYGLWAALS